MTDQNPREFRGGAISRKRGTHDHFRIDFGAENKTSGGILDKRNATSAPVGHPHGNPTNGRGALLLQIRFPAWFTSALPESTIRRDPAVHLHPPGSTRANWSPKERPHAREAPTASPAACPACRLPWPSHLTRKASTYRGHASSATTITAANARGPHSGYSRRARPSNACEPPQPCRYFTQ